MVNKAEEGNMKKKLYIFCLLVLLLSGLMVLSKTLLSKSVDEKNNSSFSNPNHDEIENIKFTVHSFWAHSKSKDPKLYDFLSAYPDSYFENCRKTKDVALPKNENYLADRTEEEQVSESLKRLSETIGTNSLRFISFNSFEIETDEAVAYIDYEQSSKENNITLTMKHEDVGLFLTKQRDNQWRIFALFPKSVRKSSNYSNNFAKKQMCTD